MESDKLEPIAIVGINLKFPSDAVSPDSFWKMLYAGRSVSGKVPAERFNVDGASPRENSAATCSTEPIDTSNY